MSENTETNVKSVNIIKISDYIIIQRQNYKKIHQLKKFDCVRLGKHNIELDNIISQKYNSIFKLESKGKNKYYLSKVENATKIQLPDERECGDDNRDIHDDGKSQKLSTKDISELQDQAIGAPNIIGKIVSNSSTFASKTEFSQEKYVKKKEKKYYEYVQILKPSILNLIEVYYRLSPAKILGLRIDSLAQILYYSNVHCFGNYLIYESGTCGLPVAAMLERIGNHTTGKLVHVHPGNEPQKQAIRAMQFSDDLMTKRYVNVNIYSVLRYYHQKYKTQSKKRKLTEIEEENPSKKPNLDTEQKVLQDDPIAAGVSYSEKPDTLSDKKSMENSTKKPNLDSEQKILQDDPTVTGRLCNKTPDMVSDKKWIQENHQACKILDEKLDALIIIAKEHPRPILDAFIDFVNLSRSIVIYSDCVQILTEVYMHLKKSKKVTFLKLSNNFMRKIQVLPGRTHPDVNRNFGGYILFGYTVSDKKNDK